MAVKLVKLNTGEELAADVSVSESDPKSVVLKNAVTAFVTPDGARLAFLPFPKFVARSSDRQIELKDSNIMFICDLDEEVENQYNANFGSGLVVPPKRLI